MALGGCVSVLLLPRDPTVTHKTASFAGDWRRVSEVWSIMTWWEAWWCAGRNGAGEVESSISRSVGNKRRETLGLAGTLPPTRPHLLINKSSNSDSNFRWFCFGFWGYIQLPRLCSWRWPQVPDLPACSNSELTGIQSLLFPDGISFSCPHPHLLLGWGGEVGGRLSWTLSYLEWMSWQAVGMLPYTSVTGFIGMWPLARFELEAGGIAQWLGTLVALTEDLVWILAPTW